MSSKKKRLEELEVLVTKYATAYYEGNPLIDDDEFDSLESEYISLGGKPRVGHGYVPKSNKVKHERVMGSLRKVRDASELFVGFTDEHPDATILFEPKWDGLALEVTASGVISTRGDGLYGENVTEGAKHVKNMKAILAEGQTLYGEAVITHNDFLSLNALREAQGERLYVKKRNAAAGIIRAGDPEQCAYLTFIPHDIALVKNRKALSLPKHKSKTIKAGDAPKHAASIMREFQDAKARCPEVITDGMVVKVKGIGDASGDSALAFKFPDKIEEGVVSHVTWDVGHTGTLTPVLNLVEPISFDDEQTSRATLHNYANYMRLSPAPGSKVLMSQSGGVIPFIHAVESAGKVKAPSVCPNCNGELEETATGVDLVCVQRCNVARRVVHALSILGVDGIKVSTVERFVESQFEQPEDAEFIETLEEMLFADTSDFEKLDRFGSKSAERAVSNLSVAADATNAQWLACLGLPEIGRTVSNAIISNFDNSIVSLLNTIDGILFSDDPSLDDFPKIDKVGPTRAATLVNYETAEMIGNVINIAETLTGLSPFPADEFEEAEITESEFTGKNVVVTGSISGMTRSGVGELLASLGATVQGSISRKTDLLIAGDNTGSSKMSKAQELGTAIISGADFLARIDAM